jgi:hypothetical protein
VCPVASGAAGDCAVGSCRIPTADSFACIEFGAVLPAADVLATNLATMTMSGDRALGAGIFESQYPTSKNGRVLAKCSILKQPISSNKKIE